ncbi:unnamed protein product [Durusdinium trenchii]|uniref:C2 domain-containing protein n=1 Tax=Durusdinium trenchii TaxID=1381693 RepID=A0ABP0N714_9DINO
MLDLSDPLVNFLNFVQGQVQPLPGPKGLLPDAHKEDTEHHAAKEKKGLWNAAQAAQTAQAAASEELRQEAVRRQKAHSEAERIAREEAVFSGQVQALLADAFTETFRKADAAEAAEAAEAASAAASAAKVIVETGPGSADAAIQADPREAPEDDPSQSLVKAPSRSASVTSRPSRRSSKRSHEGSSASQSSFSIHVQVPSGVLPGDRFFVVVDEVEYEVWAPEGCTPGEMVAMDIYSDAESVAALTLSKDSAQATAAASQGNERREATDSKLRELKEKDQMEAARATTNQSELSDGDSVATDAILIPVEIPEGCTAGETFFAEVNGVEYEILVPEGCKAGHLIYLEIPAKHAIGRFVADEGQRALTNAEVPQIAEKDLVPSEETSDSLFAEVCVPEGAIPGSNFVAVIDDTEFEVPVPAASLARTRAWSGARGPRRLNPEGFGPGDTLSLQLPSAGLKNDALQEVWAELAKVREELKEVKEDRRRERELTHFAQQFTRSDDYDHLEPQSPGASSFVEIIVPPDCHEGEAVPAGVVPGELIYMDMREGVGEAEDRWVGLADRLTSKQKRSSRPASGVRKKAMEIIEVAIPEEQSADLADPVGGQDLEMTVPEGCQAGDVLLMDLLPGGKIGNSRPASAEYKRQTLGAEAQVATVQRDPTGESVLSIGAQAEASQRDAAASAASAAPAPADASRQEEAARESQEAVISSLAETGPYRLGISILSASELVAESEPFCVCRIPGKEKVEFETASLGEKVNPEWNSEHVIEDFPQGQSLVFEVVEMRAQTRTEQLDLMRARTTLEDFCPYSLGRIELPSERFFAGLDETLSLTGSASGSESATFGLRVKVANLGTAAAYAAQQAARVEAERLEEEERARMEEAERQRQEAEKQRAIEEAERERLEALKQQALEEAERAVREEEARLKREEAERKGKIVIFVRGPKGRRPPPIPTVMNDETDELMAKADGDRGALGENDERYRLAASLKLACKVSELAQEIPELGSRVCIREARLSVAPAIFSEPKPEPKMVRGKLAAWGWMVPELRERFQQLGRQNGRGFGGTSRVKGRVGLERLPPEDTLLEAGVENNAVLRAKISPAVITASKDCTARIWNAETGSCELVLEGHNEAVCSACISPDCRYVATSSEDSSARLWYVDSGRCARVLLDHKEAVYSAAFSPDSKQVVTASEDGTAKIWVVKTGLCKLTLKGHNFAVLWAAFSPDGRSVTTTSSDGTLKIWNAKTGVCDRTLLGQKPVYLASFATDGSTFVTASAVLSTPNEGNGQFWEKKYLFVVVMGDRGVAMEVSKSRLDRHVLTKIHQSNITNRKE